MRLPPKTELDPLRPYTCEEVARLVHAKSVSWFYRSRRMLQAAGFPRPVSPFGQPRWNGADLIAWMNRPKPNPDIPGDTGNLVDFSAMLALRAATVAAGAGARRGRRPS